MTESVKLEPSVCHFIDKLGYEQKANANVVSFMIDNGFDQNGEEFKARHSEYVGSVVKYNEAQRVISAIVKEKGGKAWKIDFLDEVLTYEK